MKERKQVFPCLSNHNLIHGGIITGVYIYTGVKGGSAKGERSNKKSMGVRDKIMARKGRKTVETK